MIKIYKQGYGELTLPQHLESIYKNFPEAVIYNGNEFEIDNNIYKSSLLLAVKDKITAVLDDLKDKHMTNESYLYKSNYQDVKNDLLSQLADNRDLVDNLENKTLDELKVLFVEV